MENNTVVTAFEELITKQVDVDTLKNTFTKIYMKYTLLALRNTNNQGQVTPIIDEEELYYLSELLNVLSPNQDTRIC